MIKSYSNYSIPKTRTKSLVISSFKGVDMTSNPVNVSESRSPDAPNMMPNKDGYPVKRTGYGLLRDLSAEGRINGVYRTQYEGDEIIIIHAGTNLYYNGTAISTGNMANDFSQAVELKGKLWVLDGQTYQYISVSKTNGVYSFTVAPVSNIAKIPVITKGKRPNKNGEATSYDPFNLLTNMVEEDFTIIETESEQYATDTKKFYTSKKIDAASAGAVTAKVKRYVNGSIVESDYTEGNGFSVDRTNGCITFDTAPGKSMPIGEDTVFITYPHVYDTDGTDAEDAATSLAEARDKVNKNRFCILYGVNGAMDRVFMAGNSQEPNIDRWTDYNDPTFVGDTMYGMLGSKSSPIMGYSILGQYLVTHKKNEENDRNAWVRYGTTDADDDGLFPISNVVQGDGAITSRAFAGDSSEPIFVSQRGIYSLTSNDIGLDRIQQSRSYYIDGLLKDTDLSGAAGILWDRYYVLSDGTDLYLMDLETKDFAEHGLASSYQYECYYWPNIHARVLWVQGDQLCFGDGNGKCWRFKKETDTDPYKDGTTPVSARWVTPLMNFGGIGNKKTVMDVFITGTPYTGSGGSIYYRSDKSAAKKIRDYTVTGTLNSVRCARKMAGVNLFQVKVENAAAQPFGILNMQIDYHVGNKEEVRS